MDPLHNKRKLYIELGEIYFWTATINKWQTLLENDDFKEVIIDSLTHLSNKGKIDVFAFVIMPNHIHLIWRINQNNGKETPQGSLLKHTAHAFKKILLESRSPYPWFVCSRTKPGMGSNNRPVRTSDMDQSLR